MTIDDCFPKQKNDAGHHSMESDLPNLERGVALTVGLSVQLFGHAIGQMVVVI